MNLRRRTLVFLVCTAVLGLARGLAAGSEGVGTTAGQIVKLGCEARAEGLGGAFVAVADDAGGFLYNPAGLSYAHGSQLQATHTGWFKDASLESFNSSFSLGSMGGLGLNFNYLNTPVLTRTLLVADSSLPSRKYQEGGALSMRDVSGAVGWGMTLDSGLKLGAALKGISQQMEGQAARGFGVDAGAIYRVTALDVDLGAAVQNLGPSMTLDKDQFNLPLLWRMGGAARLAEKQVLLCGEVDLGLDHPLTVALGAEYNIKDTVFPSVGLRLDSLFNPFTFGLGVRRAPLRLDLSAMPLGELGLTWRASLAYDYDPGAAFASVDAPGVSLEILTPYFSNLDNAPPCRLKPSVNTPACVKVWTLTVKTAGDVPVFIQQGSGAPPAEIIWNGRDPAGQAAPEGRYLASLEAGYHSGQKAASGPNDVAVDNALPELMLKIGPNSLNQDKTKLDMPAELFVHRTSGHLPSRFRLEIRSFDGLLFKSFGGEVEDVAKVVWEGKPNETGAPFYSNTDYTLELSLTDPGGNVIKKFPAMTKRCVYKWTEK